MTKKPGSSSAVVQIPLSEGQHDYVNFKKDGSEGSSGLKYTVTESGNLITKENAFLGYEKRWSNYWHDYVDDYSKPIYGNEYDTSHQIGKLYFTTASQADLDAYNALHSAETGKTMSKVIVQFAGTYMDSGSNDLVKDYGIYLYDTQNSTATQYYSVATGTNGMKNVFALDPDETFGVYYDEFQPDGTIKRITTTDNWVGNYDKGNSKKVSGANEIIEYNEEHPEGFKSYTYKKFMCLLETDKYYDEITHWEFMLETMLDDPYFKVNVDDFNGNGDTFADDTPSGQPLPGTLATILISSLCAAGLRKKNKK